MNNSKKEKETILSFGNEWSKFDQSREDKKKLYKVFKKYFYIFHWKKILKQSVGFDMGCGTGRWAQFVAPKVKKLYCIDPSKSIIIAKKKLINYKNVHFINKKINDVKLKNNTQDFGYSLGVLHHIYDTEQALKSCTKLLKPGAPFLVYIYYALENRPYWFKLIWKITDILRKFIHLLPERYKVFTTDIIAAFIYWPLAKMAKLLDNCNISTKNFPLSFYKDKSFYMMRTDSRDRLGTPIEKRFTKKEIFKMMKSSGLEKIYFSNKEPFWCAVGFKSKKINYK